VGRSMFQLHHNGKSYELPQDGKFMIDKQSADLVVKTTMSLNPAPYIEGGVLHAETGSNIWIKRPLDEKPEQLKNKYPLQGGTEIYIGPPKMKCKLECKETRPNVCSLSSETKAGYHTRFCFTQGAGSDVRLDKSPPVSPTKGTRKKWKIAPNLANSVKDHVEDKYLRDNVKMAQLREGYVNLRRKWEILREEKKGWAGLIADVKKKDAEIERLKAELEKLKSKCVRQNQKDSVCRHYSSGDRNHGGQTDQKPNGNRTEMASMEMKKGLQARNEALKSMCMHQNNKVPVYLRYEFFTFAAGRSQDSGKRPDNEEARIASILRLFGGDEDEFRKWNKDFCTFMNYWNKDQKDNRLLKQCANVNEDDYWVT